MSKAEMPQGGSNKPSNKAPSEKKKALPQEIDKGSLRYLYNERERIKKAQKLAQKQKIAETEINKSRAKLESFRSEVSEKIINSLNRENGSKGIEIKEYDFMSYISALTLKGNRVKWNEKEARRVKGGSIVYIEEKDGKRVIIAEYNGKKRVVGTILEGFEKKKEEAPKEEPTPTPAEEQAPTQEQAPEAKLDIPNSTSTQDQEESEVLEVPVIEVPPLVPPKKTPNDLSDLIAKGVEDKFRNSEASKKGTSAPEGGFNPFNVPKDATPKFNPFNVPEDATPTFDPLGKMPDSDPLFDLEKLNPFSTPKPENKERVPFPNPADFLPPVKDYIPETPSNQEPETPIPAPTNDSSAEAKGNIPVDKKLGASHSPTNNIPASASNPEELTHPKSGIPEVPEEDDEPIDPNDILIPLDNIPKAGELNPEEIDIPLDGDENEEELIKMNEINFAENNSYVSNLKITIQKSELDPAMKEKALKNLEDSRMLTRIMYKLQNDIKKVIGNKNVGDEQKSIIINSFNVLIQRYNAFELECKKQSSNIVDFLSKKDFNTLAKDFGIAILDMDEELKYNKINLSPFEDYFKNIANLITSGENTGLISNKLNEMLK